MMRFISLFPCMLFAAFMLIAIPAFSEEPQSKEPGELNFCKDNNTSCNCRDEHPGYLLSIIVPCIREQVRDSTKEMTNEFAPMLEGVTYAFLTLVIAIFGVRVLMAEGDPKKDTFILLIKIGTVVFVLQNYDYIIDASFNTMQEGTEITTSAFTINSNQCEEFLNEHPDAEVPWIYFDCALGHLAGFGPGMFIGASLLGAAGAALWSGQFGMIFLMGAIGVLFFILKLIIRGCYTYLMAVMALAFLIFISPLLIPLIWMPATQQYFDRWLGAFMAMIIMPAIVMGYLTLAFIALDKIIFNCADGAPCNNDLPEGVAALLSKENIKEWWRGQETQGSETLVSNPVPNYRAAGENVTEQDFETQSQFDWLNAFWSGSADANFFNQVYTLDFGAGEAGLVGQIFFSFVALMLMTYLLLAMLNQLIQLSQVMLGGGFFMQPAVEGNPIEAGLSQVNKTMSGNIKSSMEGASGPGQRLAAFSGGTVQGLASLVPDTMRAMVSRR